MAQPAIQTAGEGVVGRMAPTPSAGLHIGNIFSCLIAWLAAKSAAGRIILRIEDVDRARCRQEHIDAILFDLEREHLTPDYDTLANIVFAAQSSDIVMTVCDGEIIYKDGEVLFVDEEETRAKASESFKKVLESL